MINVSISRLFIVIVILFLCYSSFSQDINDQDKVVNVVFVYLDGENNIYYNGQVISNNELTKSLSKFILQNGKNHSIKFSNERETLYKAYLETQRSIFIAYHEVWEKESLKRYKLSFSNLFLEQQDEIKSLYPMNITE